MEFNDILNQPAFVIHNKDLSPERTGFFTKTIKDAGYKKMIIFKAVNASDETERNTTLKMFSNPKFHFALSNGQIGCFLSHIKLYKHIIDNKIKISTIFEDDVFFHSKWNHLAPKYYDNTPKDFDIIFIGNQLTINNTVPLINHNSTFCTHAYIITLNGARKLLNLLLHWDYHTPENTIAIGHSLTGLFAIDVIIKTIQDRINTRKLKRLITWYCWNGTKYPCKNALTGHVPRNTGLVFQSSEFKTLCPTCNPTELEQKQEDNDNTE
jgi:hypothetical protein